MSLRDSKIRSQSPARREARSRSGAGIRAARNDLALIELVHDRLKETSELFREQGTTARAYAANVGDKSQVESPTAP
jgi:hypothetical protein